MEFEYDPTFPIRGLYYDRQKGCLLKLDFFGSIEPDGCFFGRHKVFLDMGHFLHPFIMKNVLTSPSDLFISTLLGSNSYT